MSKRSKTHGFKNKSANFIYNYYKGLSETLRRLNPTYSEIIRSFLLCPVIINSSGLVFSERMFLNIFNEKLLKNLRNKFKIIIKLTFSNYDKTVLLYKKRKHKSGDVLYIFPRFGITQSKLFSSLFYVQTCNYVDCPVITYDDKLKLHDYQELVKEHILANVFNNGGGGCILKLKPGLGKTFTALGIIQELKQKTLIVVHNTNMVAQWKEDIIASGVFKSNEIGEYHSKKKKLGNIIIMIVNSAAQIKKYTVKLSRKEKVSFTPREWFSQFGLVVVDECHKFTSSKFSAMYNRCQTTYMLGLSATPDENRFGLDKVAIVHLGEILDADKLLEEQGLIESDKYTTVLNIIEYSGPNRFTKPLFGYDGKINFAAMINQLCEDPYRNAMLVDILYKYYQQGRDILLFSGRRQHLITLSKLLFKKYKLRPEVPELGTIDGLISRKNEIEEKTKILMGGSKLEDIKYAKKHSRVIMSTYPWGNTGMSIPKLTTIILSTPFRHGAKQTIGRIYRKGGNSDIVRIINDIVDVRVSLRSQFVTRKKFYKTLNATKYIIKHEWDEFCS